MYGYWHIKIFKGGANRTRWKILENGEKSIRKATTKKFITSKKF